MFHSLREVHPLDADSTPTDRLTVVDYANLSLKHNTMTIIPQSTEAEVGTLCSILLDPKKSLASCKEYISPEMFNSPANRKVYEAILRLEAVGEPVDQITLTGALQEARALDSIGGPATLAQINMAIPTAANLVFYLEIVRDQYHRRELLRKCHTLEGAISASDEELGENAREMQAAIDSWKQQTVPEDDMTVRGAWLELADVIELRNDLSRSNGIEGIPTRLPTIDRVLRGLQKGHLYVIGAPPNVGKSLLASQFAYAAAEHDVKVAVFSLEMKKTMYMERLVIQSEACSSSEMKCGTFKEVSLSKMTRQIGFLQDRVFIDGSSRITTAQIEARLRRAMQKHDIGLVIIDYLQLITPSGTSRKNGNREAEVNELIRDIDSLKKTFNIPVVVIGSMNRSPDKRSDTRPRMSDFRDSGQIEFQADVILLLHFPDKDESTKRGNIIIEKHRDGETRDIAATFNKTYLRFQEER